MGSGAIKDILASVIISCVVVLFLYLLGAFFYWDIDWFMNETYNMRCGLRFCVIPVAIISFLCALKL